MNKGGIRPLPPAATRSRTRNPLRRGVGPSQEDAQQVAEIYEGMPEPREHLHQAFPPVEKGSMRSGLW